MAHVPPLCRRHARKAFTLVELLVVVGIITVLIAIALPVLGRVRDQADRVKCGANLRSIGQAMTMYVQQYRYYPGGELQRSFGAAAVWTIRLRPFLGGANDVFHCPSRDDRFRWTLHGPQPVVPATGHFVELGYESGEPLVHDRAYFSYAYNFAGSSGATFPHEQKGLGMEPRVPRLTQSHVAGEMPASRVRMASDMIAVTDSDGDGRNDHNVHPWPSFKMPPGRVHGGGANVLFCDGHVAWYRQAELMVGEPAVPADARRIRMWNNDHFARWDSPRPSGGP